jgi:hypothetical protein
MSESLNTARSLFANYSSVWAATRDGKQIARFYRAPWLNLKADGALVCINTIEETAQFLQAVAQMYHSQGWERFVVKSLSAEAVGSHSIFATVDWQAIKRDGAVAADWRHSYNLYLSDEEWRIGVTTFHVQG